MDLVPTPNQEPGPIGSSLDEQLAKLREENDALRRELGEARKNSQQYLQNVAHQLTAPLGAIKWSIEGLREPEVSLPRKLKLLSSIYSQATILVHLIKNFALMSNLEADLELGQFREQPEKVDIMRLCVNLANDFQPQAAEKGQKVVVDDGAFSNILDGKSVLMVKNLIAQAVSNLLENAVKYADLRSTITIGAQTISLPQKLPSAFAVVVKSTGIPIETDEHDKLFDRGYRGTNAKQKVPAGTGIGLYLAKRVMALHKGAIMLRTNGRDSQFMLLFPLSRLV